MVDIDELIRELECEKNDKEFISEITIRQKDILIIISALKVAEARRDVNECPWDTNLISIANQAEYEYEKEIEKCRTLQ